MKQEDYELIKHLRLNGKLSKRDSKKAKELEVEYEKEQKDKEEIRARRKQDREDLEILAHESNEKIKQYKKDGLI